MAKIQSVEPVIRICAVISRYEATRQWAIDQLCGRWGEAVVNTTVMPFEAGGYYETEMGAGLEKTIVAFGSPCDPSPLADWKLETNALERQYASASEATEPRPLNLDCGYVTQAKLVLATTKDRDHRIYLRDGIFAEVTLTYVHRQWIDHRWTYPDYRTEEVKQFANQCRSRLRQHIKSTRQFRSRASRQST
ncbi:DUF4416 family protein [Novipirellula artificiosorum]|uniref:GTP-binding protein n=1 Tax=Novipirellula artificiosorum TaxID=2528016 RepID=A0A5C6DBY6_9BACT|nr:DUF4416 family protein [Novipirellula artificiosorum]TWU34218.1 hypothetical protein Poly41_43640 [Novipirellula artificiosorum]